ncbi:tetratricopeptide repeat protein 23-like isoform X2 [Portunus trituberculatus]|uniref:tetratricopeptide repeat protein 23-like isoform X2 n=1 Tax=Portunus trituberculatus TaxID=210409 RepID=UPI001E1CD9E2|nr:tetratricopeptide repeat protein 23-like isoform X2 [Portunus trituberculatus]
MESLSDSDPDFWELGGKGEGSSSQGRRGHHRRSKGFRTFPPSEQEHDRVVGGSSDAMEDPKMIQDYDSKTKSFDSDHISNDDSDDDHEIDESNDEAKNENDKEEEKVDSTDDEHCGNNWEREEGSGGNSSSNSKSSKRTSILTGSDLPQDSPKDDTLSKDSSKSSKGSTNPGEGDGAVREFVRARALARVVHGDQHWRYCRCKVFLAKSYLYLKEYALQAEAQAKEALEILRTHLSTHLAPTKKPQVHHTLLWGYLVCGEARIRLGQLAGAQESLARALYHTRIYAKMVMRWKKQLNPSLTIDLPLDLQVKVLCAQAALYTKQKKLTKAKEKLQSSISLIEKKGSGPEDPCLVTPLQQLGQLLLEHPQTTQDNQTGLNLLTRVVHITQVSNRPGSVAECEARGLLLEHRLHLRCIETQEALRELHKLGLLFSRLHGEHSPRTAAIHNMTVQVLVQEENYPEAIKHLMSNLKHCKEVHGDFTPQVCGVLRQLSRVHALAGDLGRAALALDQCLQAETLLYGTSSRRAQASRLRLQEMIQKLPLSLRKRMCRRHPDLQNKPRFHNL